jgi:glycosyltransferase involved in cell wall biosynthesis
MGKNFSIVVICKNEGGVINHLLRSAQSVTDDIVLYDNGSTDNTLQVAHQYGVQWYQGLWEGYGKTKSKATRLAKHDWILSLDADEALDEELQKSLAALSFNNDKTVYRIAFKTFLGDKLLKWGEWGRDNHIRLFNRNFVQWDDAEVHEKLIIPKEAQEHKLKGCVLHRTMKDTVEYSHKMVTYALLNAEKYYKQGKKSTPVKRYLAPLFTFLKYYIFQAGFLDGWEGLLCARMTAFYTSLKYARLYELQVQKREIKETVIQNLAASSTAAFLEQEDYKEG